MPSFPTAIRRKLANKGEAMSGGRYPIRNATGLANAYKDYVRTGRPPAVASWIAQRAKALGLPNPVTGNPTSYDTVIAAHAKKASAKTARPLPPAFLAHQFRKKASPQ